MINAATSLLPGMVLAQDGNTGVTEALVTWADFKAILPVLVLLATGTLVLLVDCFNRGLSRPEAPGNQRSSLSTLINILGLLGAVIAGALALSSLQQPEATAFQDSIRADSFSSSVSLLVILGTFFSLLGAIDYLKRFDAEHGEFHCLLHYAAASMILFVQSNNLIMLFLTVETLSMAVYLLTSYLRDQRRSVEGGLKYFILGSFSSGFLLFGFTLIFGATGAIELPAIAESIAANEADQSLLLAGLALTIIGLGFKVGAFPFHSWLPDAYEAAPAVAAGFMSVTVKSAAIVVLLRFLVLVANQPGSEMPVGEILTTLLSLLAAATILYGNLVALMQNSVKRMLAYSAIGHTGYLLIGVVAALDPGGSKTAEAAVLFYLLPYTLMSLAAFTLLGYLGDKGQDRETFEDYRGLSASRPLLALCLLVVLVSFAGIPPTAGFWAKLHIFR
ncbi:MAG: NADH-quinone oxidoreductase subunit N, partial [Planctomycetota bacterium]|nr:NADH-quinone oxidoreductase subunit N [Planctomycetota bacterium]